MTLLIDKLHQQGRKPPSNPLQYKTDEAVLKNSVRITLRVHEKVGSINAI
jgi:hypothetical protein